MDNVQLRPTTSINLQYPQDGGSRNVYAYANNLQGTDASSCLAGANYNYVPECKPYVQYQQSFNQQPQTQHYIKPQQSLQQLPSINLLQAQAPAQAPQDMIYSQSSISAPNFNFLYLGQQDYTTNQPYVPIPNYITGANSNGKFTTNSQQRFPLSPVSLPDKNASLPSTTSSISSATSSHYSYPLPHQQQHNHQIQQHTLPALISESDIDYSSIVSCTISPSLKRKRRKRNDNSELSTTTVQDPTTQEESYPCPSCDKVFLKPYNLKSHMRSHSNEKPYACAHCSKRFCRSHDRKRHEQLHKGAKNFSCQGYLRDGVTKWGCGKKFARSDALARHFRTETGWMCIRPLMDEAKRLEESGGSNSNSNSGGSGGGTATAVAADMLPLGAPGSMTLTMSGFNGINSLTSDYKSYTQEEYDNSNMIRRMINNR